MGYWFASYFAFLDIVVNFYCRVKRHLPTKSTQLHGSPAEIKPESAIHTHRPNTR